MATDNHEMQCKRYKRPYLDHKFYIFVTDDAEGKPYAIQASISDNDWNNDNHMPSLVDWAFRGATLALRAHGAEKVIHDLRNCGLGPLTLPTIIASVLAEHTGAL